MKPEFDYDVLIIGAGPGGTSTAIRLATFGFKTALIERSQFPRSHIGICISDQTLALFNFLGLKDEFHDTRFWRRNVTAVKWGASEIKFVPHKGLHLDRGILDHSMVCKARDFGVTVYQPAQIIEMQHQDKSGWSITIADDINHCKLKVRFLVDAAGRRASFVRSYINDSPPLLALHADWSLSNALKFDGLIESGKQAWLWYAQTEPYKAIVSVFCDPRSLKSCKQRDLQDKYVHLLKQFHMLQPGQLDQQCSQPLACDATSRHTADPVSSQHIRVGDACISVDPLSSQGVHLALLSGIQAAVVINTILKMPENSELAQQFFCNRINKRVDSYTSKTKNEYARVSAIRPELFWRERADNMTAIETPQVHEESEYTYPEPLTRISISDKTVIEKAPVIDGEFVEEHLVVRHPNIDGSVAFIDGVDVIPLLRTLPNEILCKDIPSIWQKHIPPGRSRELISWLWNKRIFVEAT